MQMNCLTALAAATELPHVTGADPRWQEGHVLGLADTTLEVGGHQEGAPGDGGALMCRGMAGIS